MKSRYSHILTLIAAILAFLPVMGVDWLLDNYVRVRERAVLQESLNAINDRIEAGARDGIASLRTILADSPSLCTPTFISNVQRREMQQSLYLKQVVVENADGVQYCDAFGAQVDYSPLSEASPFPAIPRRSPWGSWATADAGAQDHAGVWHNAPRVGLRADDGFDDQSTDCLAGSSRRRCFGCR